MNADCRLGLSQSSVPVHPAGTHAAWVVQAVCQDLAILNRNAVQQVSAGCACMDATSLHALCR